IRSTVVDFETFLDLFSLSNAPIVWEVAVVRVPFYHFARVVF
ncbi:hypothetical protein, partial [Listeria monocytogenes]